MKANVAPEKIYIQSFNVSEEDAKFDKSKMFFDDIYTEEPETGLENIEYTRTDAFIEKAVSWLKDCLDNGMWIANDVGVKEKEAIIENFRKYMEE